MPPGVAWLRRMAVDLDAHSSRPFRGIRYVDGDIAAEAEFLDGPGLGVRRTALSSAMRARATTLGVELREGGEARILGERGDHVLLDASGRQLAASWVVGADGLHGRTRAALGAAARSGPRRRYGMRRHFRVAPWSDLVEVHWAGGVEAYVTPVAADLVGIAFLWSAAPGDRADYTTLLSRFPALGARLGPAAVPVTGVRGGGPFDTRIDPVARGRVLLVGDAAGYLDAITGEGLSLAFASASALVDATLAGDVPAYVRAWGRIRRQHVALTRLLLWIAERPALRRRVVRALERRPRAFRAFLALNTGAWGWTRALPATAGLALGMLAARGPATESGARMLGRQPAPGKLTAERRPGSD